MNKESSDEKLLKIIEGTDKVQSFPQAGFRQKNKKVGPGAFKPRLGNIKLAKLTLQNANKWLYAVSAALTLYFLSSFITMVVSENKMILPYPTGNLELPKFAGPGENETPDLSAFLAASSRYMFFPAGRKYSPAEIKPDEDILAAVNELKLVGIIWSDNPEVMIENTKENRTYLLKKPETFGSGRFRVKDIGRGSVILEITAGKEIKEWELR